MKIFLPALILPLLIISGCTQNQAPTGKYINQNAGFEVHKPAGWEIARECTDDCNKTRLLLSLTKNKEASINVFSQPAESSDLGKTLEEVKSNLGSIKEPTIQTKLEKDLIIDGEKAKYILFEIQAESGGSPANAIQEIALFYKNGKLYGLSATYTSENKNTNQEFSGFLQSFKTL